MRGALDTHAHSLQRADLLWRPPQVVLEGIAQYSRSLSSKGGFILASSMDFNSSVKEFLLGVLIYHENKCAVNLSICYLVAIKVDRVIRSGASTTLSTAAGTTTGGG